MTRRLAVALLITLSLAACRKEAAPSPAPAAATPAPAASVEPTAAPPVELKPGAALSVTDVQLGTAVDADNRISAPVASFAPTDTIIVAITLRNAATPATNGTVTANWFGADGKSFNEESQQRDFGGDSTVNFRVAEPKGFKPGNYRIEVSLNGSVVETREFAIK